MKHDAWERERAAREAGPDWMRALADQFRAARRRHPDDALMIVFDVDGPVDGVTRMPEGNGPEIARLKALACTAYEEAAMWAVKAATLANEEVARARGLPPDWAARLAARTEDAAAEPEPQPQDFR